MGLSLSPPLWAQETKTPEENTALEQDKRPTPEEIAELSEGEADVRSHIDTCLTDPEQRAYFLQLSQRYVAFLHGDVRVAKIETKAPAPVKKDLEVYCAKTDEFLAQLRERDHVIRNSIPTNPPKEPVPASKLPASSATSKEPL